MDNASAIDAEPPLTAWEDGEDFVYSRLAPQNVPNRLSARFPSR